MVENSEKPPLEALAATFRASESLPSSTCAVIGYDFNRGINYEAIVSSMASTGFQATNFGHAVEELNKMISWRLSDEPVEEDALEVERNPEFRASTKCKIFLGFTSNLMSSGLRETFKFLVQHRLVDVVVTTAGGVEEDFIKCLAPTFVGAFELQGSGLRAKGLNRIGNLLVPNENYCKFESWCGPHLDAMRREQEEGVVWTPSKVIARLGKEINNEDSVFYWAWKNGIPVYCPALTDGSLGDMIYFHSFKNPGLVIDIVGGGNQTI